MLQTMNHLETAQAIHKKELYKRLHKQNENI